MIIIPEVILHKVVKNALDYIRTDYAQTSDKSQTYLYKILNGVAFERYDFLVQGVKVFMENDQTSPRYLDVDLMWNMERNGAPTIYITLPAEDLQKNGNGIGNDEGYEDPLIVDTVYERDGVTVITQGSITNMFTRRYQSVYNIVISSDNSNEVTLIYHVLRALLTAFTPSMHLMGLEGAVFGGRDLNINSELIPKNLYIKSISVSLQYETSVPNLYSDPLFRSITSNGVPIADPDQ